MKFTHKQRIQRALALQENDRIPFSLWMHFPNRDRFPRRLAELALGNQKRYDMDFIKFMPYGMYTTVDMGVDLNVFEGFDKPPVQHESLIRDIKDWDKLHFVSGTEGEFAVVLEAQRLLFSMMDERVPFLQTVFSPATTLAKICSPALLVEHMRQDPSRIHRVLEMVTAEAKQFMKASIALGADGFFYASQLSTETAMTKAEHDEFVRTYDVELLNSVKDDTWFNVFHAHGAKARIKEIQDYPVQAFSWHDRDDGPSMAEVRKYSSKAFVGGLSWGKNWLGKTDAEVVAEIKDTVAFNGGKGTILGPGCVVAPDTPAERMELVHKTVAECAKN